MNFFNGFGGMKPMGGDDNCCCKIIWLLFLLSICGCGCGNDNCGDRGNDNCCWLILLLLFCGCGNNGGCC